MECHIISHIDEFGNYVYKEKQKFETMDEAISLAKFTNSKNGRGLKVIAYKCKYCYNYHIGKNGNVDMKKEKYESSLHGY